MKIDHRLVLCECNLLRKDRTQLIAILDKGNNPDNNDRTNQVAGIAIRRWWNEGKPALVNDEFLQRLTSKVTWDGKAVAA